MSEHVQVKICGIKSPGAFDAAVAGGADWVGFNFFPRSPRVVSAEQAAELSSRAPGGPGRVGLFVDPSEQEVERVLARVRLDALQLYTTPQRAAALRALFGIPVWRAVGVAERADLPTAREPIDGFLLESKARPDASRPGGNGEVFDWWLMEGWHAPQEWLLAGGLTPSNVATAIRASNATAVDVSSGVEVRQGVKDPELILQFINNAKLGRPNDPDDLLPGATARRT